MAPANFSVSGKQYVSATFAQGDPSAVTYVGNAGSVADVTMQPAKPGDIITLSGIGFGPVTPQTAAGTMTTEASALNNPVTILFGETPANVIYAGLALNDVGMYQISLEVPNMSAGDWPLVSRWAG